MPELSEYTPRIIEYLFDHHYDDHTHLFQVEWHADLDTAVAWLCQQQDEEHRALAYVAHAWLRGLSEQEMVVEFNSSPLLVRRSRERLCHVLSEWLNTGI